MGSNLAPGTEIIERSFSQRIEAGGNTVFGTLGLFTKGPVNERRKINSTAELVDVFGQPNDDNYTYFFPISKILDEAPVEIVRVEESTKNCSSVTLGLSGSSGLLITNSDKLVYSYEVNYAYLEKERKDFTVVKINPGQNIFKKIIEPSQKFKNKKSYLGFSEN